MTINELYEYLRYKPLFWFCMSIFMAYLVMITRTGIQNLKEKRSKKRPLLPSEGTAQLLRELYPEMEFMDSVLITRLWVHFQEAHHLASSDPSTRDERFPTHVVSHMQTRMKETGLWK